jgi:hypothetical protein
MTQFISTFSTSLPPCFSGLGSPVSPDTEHYQASQPYAIELQRYSIYQPCYLQLRLEQVAMNRSSELYQSYDTTSFNPPLNTQNNNRNSTLQHATGTRPKKWVGTLLSPFKPSDASSSGSNRMLQSPSETNVPMAYQSSASPSNTQSLSRSTSTIQEQFQAATFWAPPPQSERLDTSRSINSAYLVQHRSFDYPRPSFPVTYAPQRQLRGTHAIAHSIAPEDGPPPCYAQSQREAQAARRQQQEFQQYR